MTAPIPNGPIPTAPVPNASAPVAPAPNAAAPVAPVPVPDPSAEDVAILAARDAGFAYRGSPPVLHGVSLDITAGRSIGLVGESGAGKTTVLRLLLGLTRPTSGRILFDGDELRLRDRALMRRFRRGVQSVFQDPYSSLDPRQRVGGIVSEPLRSLGLSRSRGGGDPRVAAALEAVGLPADAAGRYPHEFSGG
ncbi:ATP-binding cassette domain-containing protein, partial [Streptomyces lushanensis]|uniref:ATP-binding cassette domain-containing protein n=1 Tax=Streptomyces lushanensis TaxID=1434255 RepID=UPI00114CB8C7